MNSKNIVSSKVSRVMRANKSKDTKPELMVRKALFKKGLRYRINVKKLPGTPDIVLPKYITLFLFMDDSGTDIKAANILILQKAE